MACELIHCTCVDHKANLYQMEFWATTLTDCVPPSGMVMAGGSKATITGSGSTIRHYFYNSSNNTWKEDEYGIVSAQV